MSSFAQISPAQLSRLVGTPDAPVIVDVRLDEDVAVDPRRLPGAIAHPHDTVARWGPALAGRRVAVVCQRGRKLSEGVAAWLRHCGAAAETLAGGFEGWREAGGPLVDASRLPKPGPDGATVWVTRSRPKIDRIACPWLIRRFVDPAAVFLFVTASEATEVAHRFDAAPFDIEGVHWSHRGELCTFDVMLAEFGLASAALDRLATIVRAADTARLDLAPQAAGLLAISLGLSRLHREDLAQLEAGLTIYDALYRWCRDAAEETHNWAAPAAARA